MNIEHIEIVGIDDTRLVFSTDFEALVEAALELSQDEDEGVRKFKAAQIIMDAVEVTALALALEGLLWARNEKEREKLLLKCRALHKEIYGSLGEVRLLELTRSIDAAQWWKEAV